MLADDLNAAPDDGRSKTESLEWRRVNGRKPHTPTDCGRCYRNAYGIFYEMWLCGGGKYHFRPTTVNENICKDKLFKSY